MHYEKWNPVWWVFQDTFHFEVLLLTALNYKVHKKGGNKLAEFPRAAKKEARLHYPSALTDLL